MYTSLSKNFLLCVFIGAFYFTLGNLPPKYRSRLTSIHLLALVKSNFISKYGMDAGMDAVMELFIQDLKKLVKYPIYNCVLFDVDLCA